MQRLILLYILSIQFPYILYTAENGLDSSVGYLIDGINDFQYKDARLAFGMWMKELSAVEGVKMRLDPYDSSEKIFEDYGMGQFSMLVVNPIFYLRNEQLIEDRSQEYWVAQVDKDRLYKMLLLVKRHSGIETLADLKGKRVAVRDDNLLGRLFFDAELLNAVHVEAEEHVEELISMKKSSTAILNTYFGKVDACIVPELAFRLAKEMNPALGKELQVLVSSEQIFIPMLLAFHVDMDERLLTIFKRNVESIESTVRGRNIFDLFKITGLFPVTDKELQPMRQYYRDYLTRMQRYGNGDDQADP